MTNDEELKQRVQNLEAELAHTKHWLEKFMQLSSSAEKHAYMLHVELQKQKGCWGTIVRERDGSRA